ncbi:hypothetical protein DXT76_00275 [Halobacillus trueperi]|uniref:MPN domain-containing protein n=1 Tax=Halobacillus trueperi TaxID=156205 RepID=A0A3D8VTV3_9BACI|nr:M67 family metallopeptidase [Halobacillus trueperi]RDY72737.1 hypothetical protein DXT76_00275 [Halobacillus trueperi]
MKETCLLVPASIHQQMISHCRDCLPFEGCGLLSGVGEHVRHLWPLPNEARSDRRFFVSEKYVEAAIQKAAEHKDEILAIFHSHPTTSAKPSSYDLLQHADAQVYMIIVSFKNSAPDVKGYRIINRQPNSIPVHVVEDEKPSPFDSK